MGVRPSEAVVALEDFRHGFLYDNLPRLERSIHFPLKIAIEDRPVIINNMAEWLKFKANHFDKYERALIACASLENITLFARWGGFAIGTGRIWFFNYGKQGVRVGQINVAPMRAELFESSCVVDRQEK